MNRAVEEILRFEANRKPILVVRGKISFWQSRALIKAISQAKPSFITGANFITDSKKCYENSQEVVAADCVIIKGVLHARQLKKLSVPSMKSLVHGEYYDKNWQSIGTKQLIIITDEMEFEKLFERDKALMARIKFVDV